MKKAEIIKYQTKPSLQNLLSVIGKPFFDLFIILISIFGGFLLFVFRIGKHSSTQTRSLITTLDQIITSSLASNYLKKKPIKKKTPKLKKIRYPIKISLKISPIPILLLTLFFLISYYFYDQVLKGLPSPQTLTKRTQKLTTQILDRNGQLLFKIYQDENRTPIKINSLPPYVIQAFLSIEDSNFYKHSGFSVSSVARAAIHNLGQASVQGGSTITQQLVKNALLTNEKTWQRKLKELILSVATETLYTKEEILQMYLNEVGFGGPAYGIQEASRQYFNIDASDLSLPQAAFLAGLPKAPSKYSPFINPSAAINRQKLVLAQMHKQGYISLNQLNEYQNTKLTFTQPKIDIKAPHFVMYVRDLLVDQFGEEMVTRGGLKVTTTLDLDLQQLGEDAINSELNKLSKMNVSNGAALITRPGTGEILAMIGSRNYFDLEKDGQVNLTTSLRQPGSSIKVINYALAFEKGERPNSLIKDEPISFNLPGSGPWTPKNYDGKFHGTITLRQSLANSYNIPAVMLLAKNGISNMVTLGQKMGISTWDNPSRYGLSLTLGGAEVKMIDMATVYGTLANNGVVVPLNPILKIENKDGLITSFNPCQNKKECNAGRVIKPETAFYLFDILSDNQARSQAFGFRSVLNIDPLKAAVKTGTSNDLRDNWTIGYTPDFVVATWVGNNDNTPMSRVASGVTGASPIWSKIMTSLLTNNPNNNAYKIPDTMVKVPICVYTGSLSCAGCPTRYEYFIKGSEPKFSCKPEDIQKILEKRAENNTQQSQILTGVSTSRTN